MIRASGDARGSEQARVGGGVLDDFGAAVLARAVADSPGRSTLAVVAIVLAVSRPCGCRARALASPPLMVSLFLALLKRVRMLCAPDQRMCSTRAMRRPLSLACCAIRMVIVLQNASTHTVFQRALAEDYIPFIGDRGIREA